MNKKIFLSGWLLSIFTLIFGLTANVYGQTVIDNDQLVSRYNDAKVGYQNVVKEYKKAQQGYITARQKYLQYKKAENLTDALAKAKDFLVKADESMISYLTMLSEQSKTVKGITETERTNLLNELNSDLNWLKTYQPQILLATTKEQLIDHGNQMKLHWIKVRAHAKKLVGKILLAKINWAIISAENISTKIASKIAELKAQGKDAVKLENWLTDFNSKITLAKGKRDSAIETYDKIGANSTNLAGLDAELREANILFKSGHEFIKEANKYVREAYENLRSIIKELKAGKNQPADILDDTTESNTN